VNGINPWAVVAAAVSAFVLGGAWYSPLVFGRAWQRATGLSDATLQGGNPAVIFGGSLVLSLLAAFVFALFLGPRPALGLALGAGASAGLCWVAASLGINAGYHTLQFTLYGLVLGLWH